MLKIPISFFNETEYMNYQHSLHEDDEENEIDRLVRQANGKNTRTVKPPKEYVTDLYLKKEHISSFHAAFQKTDSKELDGTAIYTIHGDIHITPLSCEDFKKIFDQE